MSMEKIKLVDQDQKRKKIIEEAVRLEDLIYHSYDNNQSNRFLRQKKTYKVFNGHLIEHRYNKKSINPENKK